MGHVSNSNIRLHDFTLTHQSINQSPRDMFLRSAKALSFPYVLWCVVLLILSYHRSVANGYLKKHDENHSPLHLSKDSVHNRMLVIFNLIDKNDDNRWSREEVKDWLKFIANKSKTRLQHIEMEMIDYNGDGLISLEEYLSSPNQQLADQDQNVSPENLARKFGAADRNQDGFVDKLELDTLLTLDRKSKGEIDRDVLDVLRAHDQDNDKRITLEEFLESTIHEEDITSDSHGSSEDDDPPSSKKGKDRKMSREELGLLKEEFNAMDSNRDGFIDSNEIRDILSDMTEMHSSINDLDSQESVESAWKEYLAIMDTKEDSSLPFEHLISKIDFLSTSFMTDMGELLRFPQEYQLDDNIVAALLAANNTTTTIPSRTHHNEL